MKNHFKKCTALITSLIFLAGGVAGCTNQNADSPKSSQQAQNSGATQGDQKTVLTFGMHVANTEEQESVTWKIVQAFMKDNPDIEVQIKGADKDEHVKNMKIAAQSNSLPDIFWMDSSVATEFKEAGVLMDLTEFLNENTETSKALSDNMKSAFNVDGVQYGLPYQSLVTGLWYNKAVFKDNGIDEPKNGTTYEELLSMVKSFNTNEVTTIAHGAKDPYSVWSFLIGIERYGYFDKIYNILDGKEKFDNPDFVKYFEKLAELGRSGAFPSNSSTMTYFQAKEQFLAGNVAMLDSGMWDAGVFDESLKENIGFWLGPVFSDSSFEQKIKMKVPSAPLCVSATVSKDGQKKTALYKFLDFYYSEAAANISFDGSVVPATNYAPNIDLSKKPAFAAVLDAINDQTWVSPIAQPDLVLNQAVQAQLYDSMYGTMLDNYTPEEALQKIDKVLEHQ